MVRGHCIARCARVRVCATVDAVIAVIVAIAAVAIDRPAKVDNNHAQIRKRRKKIIPLYESGESEEYGHDSEHVQDYLESDTDEDVPVVAALVNRPRLVLKVNSETGGRLTALLRY